MPPPKPFSGLTVTKKKELNASLNKIAGGKAGDSVPEIKAATTNLAELLQIAFKSIEEHDDKLEAVEKDLEEVKGLKEAVDKLTSDVNEMSGSLSKVEDSVSNISKQLKPLGKLSNTMEEMKKNQDEKFKAMEGAANLMKESTEAVKSIETKLEKEEEERERERGEREKERKAREEERIAYERACVAPCIMLYGFKMDRNENPTTLLRNVEELFRDTLGLSEEEVYIEKVMRFTLQGAQEGTKRGPPLVRVVLSQPSQKGALFRSLVKLKGKAQFKGLSIQNEIAKIEMPQHKIVSARARKIREDSGCRTRVTTGRGPIAIKVLFEGTWMSEKEFHEKNK